ncbi:hypothetical protein MAR_028740, partial [Mya arenaria]
MSSKAKKPSKRKEKFSSNSSDEGLTLKQGRCGSLDDSERDFNLSVSDVINEANSVLYSEQQTCGDGNVTLGVQDMASGSSKEGYSDLSVKIDQVLSIVGDMKVTQEGMKRTLESKIDNLKNEMMKNIDTKLKSLKNEISLDIGKETSRIDGLMDSMKDIQVRLRAVEDGTPSPAEPREVDHLNDPDYCIIATGIPKQDDEDLFEKANSLIRALGENVYSRVTVTGTIRLPSKLRGKPGPLKISFGSTPEKVLVLRHKMKLKDMENYQDVFIKSSKSHAERLIELNARTILRQLPQGAGYRVDANGRIRPRPEQQPAAARDNRNVLNVDGYSWFGFNRTEIHRNAPKASGGVGLLVKQSVVNEYDVAIVDRVYDGIIAVSFTNKATGSDFIVFSCYLPPEGRDAQGFFAHLLTQIYAHANYDQMVVCSDFNARIGSLSDLLTECDIIPERTVKIETDYNAQLYGPSTVSLTPREARYNLRRIPSDFMDSDRVKTALISLITQIEISRETQENIVRGNNSKLVPVYLSSLPGMFSTDEITFFNHLALILTFPCFSNFMICLAYHTGGWRR